MLIKNIICRKVLSPKAKLVNKFFEKDPEILNDIIHLNSLPSKENFDRVKKLSSLKSNNAYNINNNSWIDGNGKQNKISIDLNYSGIYYDNNNKNNMFNDSIFSSDNKIKNTMASLINRKGNESYSKIYKKDRDVFLY